MDFRDCCFALQVIHYFICSIILVSTVTVILDRACLSACFPGRPAGRSPRPPARPLAAWQPGRPAARLPAHPPPQPPPSPTPCPYALPPASMVRENLRRSTMRLQWFARSTLRWMRRLQTKWFNALRFALEPAATRANTRVCTSTSGPGTEGAESREGWLADARCPPRRRCPSCTPVRCPFLSRPGSRVIAIQGMTSSAIALYMFSKLLINHACVTRHDRKVLCLLCRV